MEVADRMERFRVRLATLPRTVACWRPVTPDEPAPYICVLVARRGDLYPVPAWRWEPSLRQPSDDHEWVLETGGAEDDPAKDYPPLTWTPTNWAPMPEVPL